VERFGELLREAARTAPARKKTPLSRAAYLRRLEQKRQRSVLKSERFKRVAVDD
jgi:hypothetical protein